MKNRISMGKLIYYKDNCENPEVRLIAQEAYEKRLEEAQEEIKKESMCESCDIENPSCDLCIGC
jgi:hypothetical protein